MWCYAGAWWEVNLEGSFQISSVKIYNRVSNKARLSNSVLQLRDNVDTVDFERSIGDASDMAVLNFVRLAEWSL